MMTKTFFNKNIFKVALQYIFNGVILLNTVFNFKLSYKLKIDPKTCTFKSLEEFRKPGRNFSKKFDKPAVSKNL